VPWKTKKPKSKREKPFITLYLQEMMYPFGTKGKSINEFSIWIFLEDAFQLICG